MARPPRARPNDANRNPGLSKAQCEAELSHLLGLRKIIWLPGVAGKDITDGHTDFYARFASPGVVVAGLDPDPSSYDHAVTKRQLGILRQARDADGRKLRVMVLQGPSTVRSEYENKEFAAGYVNFYVCNGAVVAPEFGDKKADSNTRDALRDLFEREPFVALRQAMKQAAPRRRLFVLPSLARLPISLAESGDP